MMQSTNKDTKVAIKDAPKTDIKKTIKPPKPSKQTAKKNGIGVWLPQEDFDLFVQKRNEYGFTNNSAFLKTIIKYDHESMRKDIDVMKSQVQDLHQSFSILITDINKVLQISKSNISFHTTSLPTTKSNPKDEN